MYIFDIEGGSARPLQETDGQGPTLDQLIAHLQERDQRGTLRAFAVQVAEEVKGEAPSSAGRLIGAAQRAMRDEAHAPELEAVRGDLRSAAQAATAIGLRKGIPNAAAFMTAYACTHPEAAQAAREAARMRLALERFRMRRGEPGADAEAVAATLLDGLLELYHLAEHS
ncbi:MAG: hypothetical protein ACNS61_00450 [Candidatus Wenzhouxiangella sp. M2_3B_020]